MGLPHRLCIAVFFGLGACFPIPAAAAPLGDLRESLVSWSDRGIQLRLQRGAQPGQYLLLFRGLSQPNQARLAEVRGEIRLAFPHQSLFSETTLR
ncbi:hypothetical protein MRY87_05325, partial [bacterium]|nr:hypothetical protein [bacterium]